MTSDDLHRSLPTLFRELVHGTGETGFMLNPHDAGLLAALDRLSADEASTAAHGGATIAAHVDHLRFGLSLMNLWADGEADPFTGAAWGDAWKTHHVTASAWDGLRRALREQVEAWLRALEQPRAIAGHELDSVIGSIAHLAYHLGAIRQIQAGARGPRDTS